MPSVFHRLNTFLLVLLVLMAGAIIAVLAHRASAGPLDPPGTPSSTLPQVEPRMPIPPVSWNGTFPIVISQSGSYFLTRTLTDTAGGTDGIDITSGDVTIDLNGFALSTAVGGTGINDTGAGSVVVRGGVIRGWSYGLYVQGPSGNVTLEDCQIVGNTFRGVDFEVPSVMRHCFIADQPLSADGVFVQSGSTIEDSIFTRNSGAGNYALDVSGNHNAVRGNQFYNNTATIALIGSSNIFLGNTMACGGIVTFGSPTNNTANFDFTKDGTNVCTP